MDDRLVKSLHTVDHLIHLIEMLGVLRVYNMKLNPNKCAFDIFLCKFLGFMINQRRIEVNPDKIKAVIEIETLWTVRRLNN